jgi:hypothetical protein
MNKKIEKPKGDEENKGAAPASGSQSVPEEPRQVPAAPQQNQQMQPAALTPAKASEVKTVPKWPQVPGAGVNGSSSFAATGSSIKALNLEPMRASQQPQQGRSLAAPKQIPRPQAAEFIPPQPMQQQQQQQQQQMQPLGQQRKNVI